MLKKISLALVACSLMLPVGAWPQAASAFDRGRTLFQQRRWAEAALVFDQVEKAEPGQTDAVLYRSKCLVNLGEFASAGDGLESYAASHPQSEDAAYLLAYVRFRQDRPQDSLRLYTAAAKLKTPSADDLKIVSLDYVLLNDFSDAAHYLELALNMDPGNTEALYHLGRVRYQQNRFDDAIEAFRAVLKREPENAKAADNLGLSLEAKNQTAEAIEWYRKAIELDKAAAARSEQPYVNLALLLEKSDQAGEAFSLLTTAEGIATGSSKIHYELGKILFDRKKMSESQREAERAVQLDANNSAAHYLLGRIFHAQGDNDRAATEFKLTNQLMHAADAKASGMATGTERR